MHKTELWRRHTCLRYFYSCNFIMFGVFVVLTFFLKGLDHSYAIKWLSMDKADDYLWSKSDCTKENLGGKLSRFCKRNLRQMAFLPTAISATKYHCKEQFRYRRWNCSNIDKKVHGIDLREDTKESAFVHALFSASLAHSIAKACIDGRISGCSCAKKPAYLPLGKRIKDLRFSSCTNFLRIGIRFAQRFADARWKRKKINAKHISSELKLHNNKLGREMLIGPGNVHCRCHGVSGNCAVRSCWKRIPFLREAASNLQALYDRSILIVYDSVNKSFVSKWLGTDIKQKQMIYAYESPNYCIANDQLGVSGTQGRSCNKTANGYHSCENLCCGRGVRIQRTQVIEKCHCKYVWCCYVKCKDCKKSLDEYICK